MPSSKRSRPQPPSGWPKARTPSILGWTHRSRRRTVGDSGSKASHLWDALCRAYEVLGFDSATGGDEVLRDLVLARIIEPTSKADSLRVLAETGVASRRTAP